MRFLGVVVALAIKEFEQRCPKLTSRERRKINPQTRMYLFIYLFGRSFGGGRLFEEFAI